MSKSIHFRTEKIIGTTPRVERENARIIGASAAQAVEALGHGVLLDQITLNQVASLGNQAGGKGVKVRFTHPGMCSDGLGTMIGHARNFRTENDKTLCDIQLDESAKLSPNGDLYHYVLQLAENNPQDFGLSIVFTGQSVWKLDSGAEVNTRERPENAVGDKPFARLEKLHAVDFVDEPAANRDGLFGSHELVKAFSATGSEKAEQAFAALDEFIADNNIDLTRAEQLIQRYFATRKTPPTGKPPMKLSAVTLLALAMEFPTHLPTINELATADKDESDIRKALHELQFTALKDQVTQLTKQLSDKDKEHFTALQAEKTALEAEKAAHLSTKNKLAALEQIKAGAGDPGGNHPDASPDAVLRGKWDALSAEQRLGFDNDFDAFKSLQLFEQKKLKFSA